MKPKAGRCDKERPAPPEDRGRQRATEGVIDDLCQHAVLRDDVDAAIAFYTEQRLVLEVDDLVGEVERLRAAGASFRGEIVNGFGDKQIVLDDPAGNPVELFQPPSR